FQRQGEQGGPEETQRLRRPHGRTGLHGKAGTPVVGMVSAGSQVAVTRTPQGWKLDAERTRRTSSRPLLPAFSPEGFHELCDRPSSERQEQEHGQPPALPAPLSRAHQESRG